MKSKSHQDWRWLAGFLDADGCFGYYGNRPLLAISQTDRSVMEEVQAIVGSGSLRLQKSTQENRKDAYKLHFGPAVTRDVCERVLPYLKRADKRKKAEFILQWKPKKMGPIETPEIREAKKKALDWYRNGKSAKLIAGKLGLKEPRVSYWIRQAGLSRSLQDAQRLRRQRE